MWTTFLIIIAVLIIVVMVAYAGYLLLMLQKQKKAIQHARTARTQRLKESIVIIAKAMQNGDCNHSEGVLRLKMLLDPLGKKLKNYQAMNQLYEVVMDMPTHEKRRELKKNERMRLDLQRESAEADLEKQILLEIHQLLADMEHI
ncbi:DUF2489 domain-containing protein [Pasteurella canis]|uniref:Transmembrane protein n=1 Tax=Pasteurella canis TaxID=753 RepID=A0A379EW90_9PAST|nr:DUF2489 domain-containing protein [Pasteurella canis]UAY77173.1 DUF2489 domain-containing protein [Pasteurella canis]UDW83223.1 DUF2489 domain-containing protein [Pasteurella canis]SUC10572.1 transmembrane protein [Pasteurella canis]